MATRPTGDAALAADPFDWPITKGVTVLISRGGRPVVTVGGTRGAKLAAQLESSSEQAAEHLLALRHGQLQARQRAQVIEGRVDVPLGWLEVCCHQVTAGWKFVETTFEAEGVSTGGS